MYLTYDEYLDYGGTLDETAFNDIELDAEGYVDWYTFNRLQDEDENNIPERVKKCMYQIIKLIQRTMGYDSAGNTSNASTDDESDKGVLSQSNDGVSISYNILSAKDAIELAKKDIDNSINRYLQGVRNSLGRKLLYRGIYPDE